jgi:hypothetical protein
MKMLLLSAKVVTQSLTKMVAPLTLLNKRLKCGLSRSLWSVTLNSLLSKKACLASFRARLTLKMVREEA